MRWNKSFKIKIKLKILPLLLIPYFLQKQDNLFKLSLIWAKKNLHSLSPKLEKKKKDVIIMFLKNWMEKIANVRWAFGFWIILSC
jgi:hypothetical protein